MAARTPKVEGKQLYLAGDPYAYVIWARRIGLSGWRQ
jgi:hypothetical protein